MPPEADFSPEADEQDLFGNGFLAGQLPPVEEDGSELLRDEPPVCSPEPDACVVPLDTDESAIPLPPAKEQAQMSVTGGTPQQVAAIDAAIIDARRMLRAALSRIDRTDPENVAILDYNFHAHDASTVAAIKQVLTTTAAALEQEVPISVEDSQPWFYPDAVGYVRLITSMSDIHLPPKFFGQPAEQRAKTIIHEAAHKYAGVDDYAYVDKIAEFSSLSTGDALLNADSYSNLAGLEFDAKEREDALNEDATERQTADAHAGELWAGYVCGSLILWETDWVSDEGLVVPSSIWAEALYTYFRDCHEAEYQECVAALSSGQSEGPFTTSDGTYVDAPLFEMIAQHEGIGW